MATTMTSTVTEAFFDSAADRAAASEDRRSAEAREAKRREKERRKRERSQRPKASEEGNGGAGVVGKTASFSSITSSGSNSTAPEPEQHPEAIFSADGRRGENGAAPPRPPHRPLASPPFRSCEPPPFRQSPPPPPQNPQQPLRASRGSHPAFSASASFPFPSSSLSSSSSSDFRAAEENSSTARNFYLVSSPTSPPTPPSPLSQLSRRRFDLSTSYFFPSSAFPPGALCPTFFQGQPIMSIPRPHTRSSNDTADPATSPTSGFGEVPYGKRQSAPFSGNASELQREPRSGPSTASLSSSNAFGISAGEEVVAPSWSSPNSQPANPPPSSPTDPSAPGGPIVAKMAELNVHAPRGGTWRRNRRAPSRPMWWGADGGGGGGDASASQANQIIRVRSLDLKILQNAQAHHTDKFEKCYPRNDEVNWRRLEPNLVIRRGQTFEMEIIFDRPFNEETDDIQLVFEIGDFPQMSKGTLVKIVVSKADVPKTWAAQLRGNTGNQVQLAVMTPPTCIIGKWALHVETMRKTWGDSFQVQRYRYSSPVYILFNAWAPDDQVFMASEEEKAEYVLNDVGKMFTGNYKQIGAKPWNFGMHEDPTLDCTLYLLDRGELSYAVRGSAAFVARKLSAMVNSQDDEGLIIGNWSNDYSDGTAPGAWTGSHAIMDEFWRTRMPVKYGQCWVYAGVLNTVCRTVGIPTRCTSNYASAHDTDATITIDIHWGEDDRPIDYLNRDSIWNFHVWNEGWMKRPDLPAEYSGWQVIDSTPQETSEGIYCVGPTSCQAIKTGQIQLAYDGPFVFAEVNSDKWHWRVDRYGNYSKMMIEKDQVGMMMCTKQLGGLAGPLSFPPDGDQDLVNISRQYKFMEGTNDERRSVFAAVERGARPYAYVNEAEYAAHRMGRMALAPKAEDVVFKIETKDFILVGQDFQVALKVQNASGHKRKVECTLFIQSCFYTGVPVDMVKKEKYSLELPPEASSECVLHVSTQEYLDLLVDQYSMRIYALARVEETKQIYAKQDDFRLRRPDLRMEAKGETKVGVPFDVTIAFVNPLPRTLRRAEFRVDGSGLTKPKIVAHGDVGAGREARVTVKITPQRSGDRTLIASFSSSILEDVTGYLRLRVAPPSTERL